MIILSIDTSCDETSVAVTQGRHVLSNVIYSQVLLHKKWGGGVPSIAKRAHEERIDFVVEEALRKFMRCYKKNLISKLASRKIGTEDFSPSLENRGAQKNLLAQTHANKSFFLCSAFQYIDAIAVTQGPGLAMALEVGIRKAKELCETYHKKLIPVNHLEGHIYSPFVENREGNPNIKFNYPYLTIVISGGHTEIVKLSGPAEYEILGETVDDAAGEALDKAAKMLGLGYPGGAVIERLASEVGNKDFYAFPRPMLYTKDLQFSFSGIKTSLYYFLRDLNEEDKSTHLKEIVSSYQEAVFETLLKKARKAIKQTGIRSLVVGGGVIANQYLRRRFRKLVKESDGSVLFPSYPYLTGDNAAMIGVAAWVKAERGEFAKDLSLIDRIPRMRLSQTSK